MFPDAAGLAVFLLNKVVCSERQHSQKLQLWCGDAAQSVANGWFSNCGGCTWLKLPAYDQETGCLAKLSGTRYGFGSKWSLVEPRPNRDKSLPFTLPLMCAGKVQRVKQREPLQTKYLMVHFRATEFTKCPWHNKTVHGITFKICFAFLNSCAPV